MDKVPITVRGFAALEAELKRRQQEERPRIIQAIAEARALIGKAVGDTVEVVTPGGGKSYEIVGIQFGA